MWYTTRYEGFDAPKFSNRGPTGHALVQTFSSGLLRTGFLLKWIGLTGLIVAYYMYEGRGLFTYDLKETSEAQRDTQGFRCSLACFQLIQSLGALYLLFFQTLLADDASWSRGYRAGSKMLSNAAFLDVASSTLQFIIYVYMDTHYDKVWWNHFTSGGTEWLISTLARLLNAFSLLYYASGLFLLEVYHDNGTNDWHGVLNAFIFTVAGIAGKLFSHKSVLSRARIFFSEILVLAYVEGSIAIILQWIALVSALVWAMAFEQEVNASQPLLNEPELTNEIESQVEKFARARPLT